MLSNDDHPGIFAFMVGLIIVVMAGVSLSLLVDRRFGFSGSGSSLERSLKADEAELAGLEDRFQRGSREFSETEPKRRMMTEARESILRQKGVLDRRRTSLTTSRDELRRAIPAIGEEFSRYRSKYRAAVWDSAVGQSLGNLTIRGGREYRQAVITRVTDVGLEIRHEDGIARVQAPDLNAALQERFQWNDEERRARLKEEDVLHESIARVPDSGEETQSETAESHQPARENPEPDSARLESLRDKVKTWKSKVAQLTSERNQALSAASSGGQSSVPGSLETWQAKAGRLGAKLSKARSELAAAKAELAMIAPHDPLLRPDPERD